MNESKRIISMLLSLMMTLSLAGCNFSQSAETEPEASTQMKDGLLEENEELKVTIADLNRKIAELTSTKEQLLTIIGEQKASYNEDELSCVEIIDYEGNRGYKVITLIDRESSNFDETTYVEHFNSMYDKGPNFRVTEKSSTFYLDPMTNNIVGRHLYLGLQDCPDKDITPVTGANYIRTEFNGSIITTTEYVEGLIVQYSRTEKTEGANSFVVRPLYSIPGYGSHSEVWTLEELEELENHLNGLTNRDKRLLFMSEYEKKFFGYN